MCRVGRDGLRPEERAGPVSIDRSTAALQTAGISPDAAALGLLALLLIGP